MTGVKINHALLDTNLQLLILQELANNAGNKTFIAGLNATRGITEDVELTNLLHLRDGGYIIMDRLHNIGSNYYNLRADIFLLITQRGAEHLRHLGRM